MMYLTQTQNLNNNSFPRQKLARFKKGEQWKKDCINGIINECHSYSNSRRSPMKQKQRNYDIFNNKIKDLDFTYVTNPFPFPTSEYGTFNLPASIKPLDILSSNFMLLMGEEGKRIFSPIVKAVNADSISSKETIKKDTILNLLQDHISKAIQESPQSEEELLKQLKKYSTYSPKDLRESQAQHLLTYMMKHDRLDIIFEKIWGDALLAGEECVHIDEITGAAKMRAVNPLELYYVLPSNSNYIDEATKIYERNIMSAYEIIDEFYEVLTNGQIDDLENYCKGNSTAYDYSSVISSNMTGIPSGTISGDLPLNLNLDSAGTFNTFMDEYTKGIPVHRCTWASMRKIFILHYMDQNNQEQELLVDEIFKEDKDNPDQWLEPFWIKEYYQGIRIGKDMYLPCGPKKHQFRGIDSLSKCKSGYVGTVYSCNNSQSVSLMDRVVPWLFYYLVVFYRLELDLAKDHGKIANFDLSLMPDDWTPEKSMYYAVALGFRFIDSYQESAKGSRKGILNQSTNEGRVMDTTTSQQIQHKIVLLDYLKQQIEETCGISRQRKGQLTPTDAVGTSERATVQSSYITEPYFKTHNYTKLRALDCLIKVAQECIENGSKSYMYITDDMQEIFGTIDGRDFNDADLEVFLSDSSKDNRILEEMKMHISEGLQNDKLLYSQIGDILGTESIADAINKMKQVEQERQANTQQEQEKQLNIQMKIHQEQMTMKQQELDLKRYISDTKNETTLRVKEMEALAIDEGSSPDAISAIGEQAIKQQEVSQKTYLEQQKLANDRNKITQELKLKEKEFQMKSSLEDKKLQQIDQQNKNQEKLSREQSKREDKMNKAKIELEKIKGKAALIKARQKPKTPKK